MPTAIIITALPVEYTAVRAHIDNLEEEHYKGTVYEKGTFTASGRTWDVAIAQVGGGNAGTAFEVERAITRFDPELALFVGVAGGVKDVILGDVVAATAAHNYERGKDEQSFRPRGDSGESSHALVQCAKAEARKNDWINRIKGTPPLKSPTVFVAEIAAGEKVVADTLSATYKFLRNEYSQCIAVEMEGRGFLKATHANDQVKALIIRGISDMIDGKAQADSTGSQEIASRHAAAFAFEMLSKTASSHPIHQLQTLQHGGERRLHGLNFEVDISFIDPDVIADAISDAGITCNVALVGHRILRTKKGLYAWTVGHPDAAWGPPMADALSKRLGVPVKYLSFVTARMS